MVASIIILSCDRFDHKFISDLNVDVEEFFAVFSDSLSTIEQVDLPSVMEFYHQDYLNNGTTKDDMEDYFDSLFDLADSVGINSELMSFDDNNNVSWRIIVKNIENNETLVDSLISDKLIEERNSLLFYGNQLEPPDPEMQKVIVQLFTGTWCPSCPLVESALHDLKAELGNQFAYIEFHIQDEITIGSNYDYMTYYGVGALPSAIIQGQTVLQTFGDETIDYYRNAISNYANQETDAKLENFSYVHERNSLNCSLEIAIEANIEQENLFLYYSLVEEISDVVNYALEPCAQVTLANGNLDLTSSDLSAPVDFNLDIPLSPPDDINMIIYLQTIEDPYNPETCKAYYVIEENIILRKK